MSDAICQPAFSAAQTPLHNGDAPAYGQSLSQSIGAGSDSALITKVMHARNSQPPLVLTTAMERQAMILDRNRAAKMLDMQMVHRLEGDLRKLTNRILAKGVCSNDQPSMA